MRKQHAAASPPPGTPAALPVGSCYVSVGGYGVVEIIVRYDPAITGPGIALALPYHTPTAPADCLVRPTDILLICNANGLIAEIPVHRILDQPGFAGFGDLNVDPPPAPPEAGMPAFERFLAGVSARTLNEQERRARDAGEQS